MRLKFFFFYVTVVITLNGFGQETTRAQQRERINELHRNRSAVERFEHNLLDTASEREQKRMAVQQKRKRLLAYLDTVSIPRSLHRNLVRDLKKNPFSNRLKKFLIRYNRDMGLSVSNQAIAQRKEE